MGFVMPHVTILIAGGAVGLALLFQIIGLAAPGWITGSRYVPGIGTVDAQIGLWKGCSGSNCVEYTSSSAYLDACRAFGILGVLAMAASLAFALLICFMNDKKIFTLAAPAAAAAGAFCALIEFAVFAGENSGASDYFGYSFALTVVACVLCIVAAVLFFLGRSRAQ